MNHKLTLDGLSCPTAVEYRPVCGVVAVAAAAGITFDAAWRALAPYYVWRPGVPMSTRADKGMETLRAALAPEGK